MATVGVALHRPSRPSASLRRPLSTGNKPLRRLLTSLDRLSGDPPAAADRVIRKLLSSHNKSSLLHALSHLLFSSSPLAITMYQRIRSEPWFRWNPTLAAGVAALLAKSLRTAESDSLVSSSLASLSSRDADLFRCALIESYAAQGLRSRVSDVYDALLAGASPTLSKRKACEAAVKALCGMGLPSEAEAAVTEMGARGMRPSGFEFRVLAQSYGKLGLFEEMVRVLEWMQSEGWVLDTLCCNAVISCYGDRGEVSEVLNWVKKMRISGIPMSVHTYNVITNSCPAFVAMVKELELIPLSIDEAVGRLKDGCFVEEGMLLEELVTGCEVLGEVCEWGDLRWEVDLHGCHPGSAFAVFFLWLEELRRRFQVEEGVVREVSLVCGTGRHSVVQGESPVRKMVAKVLFKMKSPLKMDRKNPGRFVAKGKVVKEWSLCS